jgi:PTS system mannose-specific IIA component
MIVGPIANCRAISIDRSCSVDEATDCLAQAVSEVGADGEGVLVLTDMFGGTPTNIAAEFLDAGRVDILTGLNLPMLIKASSARSQKNLVELVNFLHSYGQQAILRPADLLK